MRKPPSIIITFDEISETAVENIADYTNKGRWQWSKDKIKRALYTYIQDQVTDLLDNIEDRATNHPDWRRYLGESDVDAKEEHGKQT